VLPNLCFFFIIVENDGKKSPSWIWVQDLELLVTLSIFTLFWVENVFLFSFCVFVA
jgi:hypothetical protein